MQMQKLFKEGKRSREKTTVIANRGLFGFFAPFFVKNCHSKN